MLGAEEVLEQVRLAHHKVALVDQAEEEMEQKMMDKITQVQEPMV
jgi:hypothetical protein